MMSGLQRSLRRVVPRLGRDRGDSSKVHSEMVKQGSELKRTSWAKEKRHPYCPFPTTTLLLTDISCTALCRNLTIFTTVWSKVTLLVPEQRWPRTEADDQTPVRQVSEPVGALRLLTHANSSIVFHNYRSMLEPLMRQLLGLVLYLLLTYRKWLGRSWTIGGLFGLNEILLHPFLAL